MNNILKLKIPKNVNVFISNNYITIKGELGEESIYIENSKIWLIKNNHIFLLKNKLFNIQLKLATIKQAFIGVKIGFRQQLNLIGVGYKCYIEKNKLIFKLGYSHEIIISIPSNLKIYYIKQNCFIICGNNKQKVMEFASFIQKLKIPEPYKGKGILFKKQTIKLKQGKK